MVGNRSHVLFLVPVISWIAPNAVVSYILREGVIHRRSIFAHKTRWNTVHPIVVRSFGRVDGRIVTIVG